MLELGAFINCAGLLVLARNLIELFISDVVDIIIEYEFRIQRRVYDIFQANANPNKRVNSN